MPAVGILISIALVSVAWSQENSARPGVNDLRITLPTTEHCAREPPPPPRNCRDGPAGRVLSLRLQRLEIPRTGSPHWRRYSYIDVGAPFPPSLGKLPHPFVGVPSVYGRPIVIIAALPNHTSGIPPGHSVHSQGRKVRSHWSRASIRLDRVGGTAGQNGETDHAGHCQDRILKGIRFHKMGTLLEREG